MAKKSYCGINNIARNIPNTGYCGVNNIARRLVKGYIGDSQGVARVFWDRSLWRREADIPYSFYRGKAVVYRGKIHLLGCNEYPTNHYSWDGTTWVQESTLPYTMDWGDAVVYNDRIHIFGGVGNTTDINYAHWAWDGVAWVQLANMPIVMNGINYAHIFKNKILLASTAYGAYGNWRWLCSWDGNQWTRVDSGVGNNGVYSTAILDDLIYMLGDSGTAGTKYFYTDGANPSGWVGILPYPFYLGYALRYGGKIHMLGSHARTPSYSYPYVKNHYSFDGQNFEEVSEMPYPFYNNPAVIYKGRIHIFGSGDSNYRTAHWSYGQTHRWKQIADSPIDGYGGSACVYQGKIHLFKGTDHYSFDGTTWTRESTLPGTTDGGAITVVYRNQIFLLNNRSTVSGVIGFYAWNGTSWVQKSTTGLNMILYGMNNGCVYNGKITIVSSRHGSSGFFRRIWQYEEDALGNGTWTNVSATGNTGTTFESCCTYEDEVHYAGNSGGDYSRMHYTWDGNINKQQADIPYGFYDGFMLEFENRIHFIGSSRNGSQYGGDCRKKHYTWDGWQYEEQDSLLANTFNCPAVVYNDRIYLFGSSEVNKGNNVFVY